MRNGGIDYDFFKVYSAALFFLAKTFTCVGYGNIVPQVNAEIVYVMIIELIGVAFYSYIVGTFFTIKFQKSYFKIIEEKERRIGTFISKLSSSSDFSLPNELVTHIRKNLEVTQSFSYKKLFNLAPYFSQLKPDLQSELTKKILKETFMHFREFF